MDAFEESATPDTWPPRFTIDTARILELLTGDRFYSSKDAALREAILNSIDACHRRAMAEEEYTQQISVTFDDGNLTVTISDNGDGMGFDEMQSLFARIGASMARVSETVESVGEFGIGVISYFLVSDEFEVHSSRKDADPVALVFRSDMLDAEKRASVVAVDRADVGTTLILHVRDQALFDLLVDKYAYWCRSVDGIRALREPGGRVLTQGSTVKPGSEVNVELPDWAETAHIGPPAGFDRWSVLDGRGVVDILYRGVFVQREPVDGLWGLEGTMSVHPKQLKPQLNREGFLADDLKARVVPFLESIHPQVLQAGLASLGDALDDPAAKSWSVEHLVALWLAVPRNDRYAAVVSAWDAAFRSKKLFRLLGELDEREVTLDEIEHLPRPLYFAPDNLGATTPVVRTAVRVLRAQGKTVLRGLLRDGGFLETARFVAQSTSEFLLTYFAPQLEDVIRVEQVADGIAANTVRIEELFSTEPKVALVRLGDESAPLVQVAGELWINLDNESGRAIVQSVCAENQGRRSLLVACYANAEPHVNLVSAFWRAPDTDADHLGLVARQHLRRLAK